MPHCILEHSSNVLDNYDYKDFFSKLHTIIIETGPFNLDQIKSRVIKHNEYLVGDGSSEMAFVTLQIKILSGRELMIRKRLSEGALALLEKTFPLSRQKLQCSITVAIEEIDRETHSRAEKQEVS